METIIRKIDKNNIDPEVIEEAGNILKNGGLVAFPKRRTGSVSNRDRIWSGCRCAASGSIKKDICGKGTAIG